MVCYCLDLRGDSQLGKFLGNKIVSIIAAVCQFLFWFSSLMMSFIIQSESMKQAIQRMDNATLVSTIIFLIILNLFSAFLIFGLFKNREVYIQIYLIFNIVVTVLIVISFFVNLFTRPKDFGLAGILGSIIILLLNILFYFIIRNYYLSLTSRPSNRNPA